MKKKVRELDGGQGDFFAPSEAQKHLPKFDTFIKKHPVCAPECVYVVHVVCAWNLTTTRESRSGPGDGRPVGVDRKNETLMCVYL